MVEFKPIEVKLLGAYGSDRMIAEQAWYSTGKENKEATDSIVRNILEVLISRKHMKPFEVVDFHFEVAWPISCDRQQQTYRMQRASIARSGRYGSAPMAFMELPKDLVGPEDATYNQLFKKEIERVFNLYEANIAMSWGNIPVQRKREIFRDWLPQGQMTSRRFKIDLRNFIHLLQERRSRHAQKEIAYAADQMLNAAKGVCPITFDILATSNMLGDRVTF